MEHDQFIGQVQQRARLASRGDAERAVRATLETLADRLTKEMAEHLAAQLPIEIGHHLKGSKGFERLSLDDFFRGVSEREGVELPNAVFHTRVVIEVVGEAVTPGVLEKVRNQLPEEFERLFDAGSQGSMRRND